VRATVGAAIIAVLLSAAASPALADTIKIEAKGLVFEPAEVSAHVGDTIEWTNSDFVAHTATARNHDWDIVLPPHSMRQMVLKKPGSVEYYCRFHPTMKGQISAQHNTINKGGAHGEQSTEHG
jgi:plastocyanin